MISRNCARCGGVLPPGRGRPAPAWVKVLASTALAFMHGGMWAHEELSRDYCAKCRRTVSAIALGLASVILAAAAFGVALWLRGPRP